MSGAHNSVPTTPGTVKGTKAARRKWARSQEKARARDARIGAAQAALLPLTSRRLPPSAVEIHVGPTNSGKTHAALVRLLESGSGVYAGPLRMLVREVFDRLDAAAPGQVGLLTGEESINPHAPILCVTVEAAPLTGDVLVLDETHWVGDRDRGWAWTRLLVHGQYDQMFVIGDRLIEPVIRSLVRDAVSIKTVTKDRLVPLKFAGGVNLAQLPPRSAVVAFSRKAVLSLARRVHESGKRPYVLYGALPPAVRRDQVARFIADPDGVLVCTDVIGHGINLPLDHVFFAETAKFDGESRRSLTLWEAAQIGGRAGRFGLSTCGRVGYVTGLGWGCVNTTLVQRAAAAGNGTVPTGLDVTQVRLRPDPCDVEAVSASFFTVIPAAWRRHIDVAFPGQTFSSGISTATTDVAQRLDGAGLVAKLGVARSWELACLPVDDGDLVVAAGRTLAGEQHTVFSTAIAQLQQQSASSALEVLEQAAAAARALLPIAKAYPGLGGLSRSCLVDLESQLSAKISEALISSLRNNTFGWCTSCGQGCAPWFHRCDSCHLASYVDEDFGYYGGGYYGSSFIDVESRREEKRLERQHEPLAAAEKISEVGFQPGDLVTSSYGHRVGVVVKVNKVSVKIRMVGGSMTKPGIVEKNLNPVYLTSPPEQVPTVETGTHVLVRDSQVRTGRTVTVTAVEGPMFEGVYTLKNRQTRTRWFDVLDLLPDPAQT